ncbi:MAG: DUF4394 domain-containing protein [Deltaproteobacteria bacterium]|nr:DUF4394 domain-containing protein [Deltaproteobacteria bacterium]
MGAIRRGVLVVGSGVLAMLVARSARAETLWGLANMNTLVRFDSASPGIIDHAAIVTGLEPGEIIQGIDFRPATGQLMGLGPHGGGGKPFLAVR